MWFWWVEYNADLNKHRKIPKISPGAYIFQRPFLRGLFLEGLIYGGKFVFQKLSARLILGLSRVCINFKNSSNSSSVYISLCKYIYRKKGFYSFYELTFLRKHAKLFVMILIKREILTTCKVVYMKGGFLWDDPDQDH